MSSATQKLTWHGLTKMEPQLLALYKEARAVDGSTEHFCANAVWYERFKPRLFHLVGWECRNPALKTQEAWDLAYETIYDALPPCRDCLCL